MKTQEEIQKRLNSLEESIQIEQEIDFIIGKIETLKWVLS